MASPPIPSRSASLNGPSGPNGTAGPQSARSHRGDVQVRRWEELNPNDYHREKGYVVVGGEEDDDAGGRRMSSWFKSVFAKRDDDKRGKKAGSGGSSGANTPANPAANSATGSFAGAPQSVLPAAVAAAALGRAASDPNRGKLAVPNSPARVSTESSNSSKDGRDSRPSDDVERKKLPELGRTFSAASAAESAQTAAGGSSFTKLFSKLQTGLQKTPSELQHAATMYEAERPPRASVDRPFSYSASLGSTDLWPSVAFAEPAGADQLPSRRASLTVPHGAAQALRSDLSLRRRASPIPALSRSRGSKHEAKVVHATPWGKVMDPVRHREDNEFVVAMRAREVPPDAAPIPPLLAQAATASAAGVSQLFSGRTPVAASPAEAISPLSATVPSARPAAVATSPSANELPNQLSSSPSTPSILGRMSSIVEREERVEKEKRFESMVRGSRLASLKEDGGLSTAEADEDDADGASNAGSVGAEPAAVELAPEEPAAGDADPADTLTDAPEPPPAPKEAPAATPIPASLLALLASSKSTPVSLTVTAATLPRMAEEERDDSSVQSGEAVLEERAAPRADSDSGFTERPDGRAAKPVEIPVNGRINSV